MMTRMMCLLSLTALTLIITGCPTTTTPLPVADAGPDQMVSLGDTVTLDGSASSGTGSLTYQWLFSTRPTDSAAVLSGAGGTSPTFTADQPGTYTLTLTVFNSGGSSTPDSVTITTTGNLVTVPDLAGLTEVEATAALSDAGLRLGDRTTQSSPTVPEGQVLAQDPVPSTQVAPDSSVAITLSIGPATQSVPQLTGQTQAEAEAALTAAGLTLGEVTATPSDTVPEGEVLLQSIEAGTMVNEGSAVNLELSSGPAVNVQQVDTFNLRTALNDPGDENVVRPDAVAIDVGSGRIYIASLLSRHIAIYNTATGMIEGTLDSGFPEPGRKRLFVDFNAVALFVVFETTNVLSRIDIASNTISETVSLDGDLLDIAITGVNNYLYLTFTDIPGVQRVQASSLADLGYLAPLEGRTGQLYLDPQTGNLYLLDSAPESDEATLTVYNRPSDQITSTTTFDIAGVVSADALRFDVDTAGSRFFVLSGSRLDSFGMDGIRIRALVPRSGYSHLDIRYLAGDVPANDRILALGLANPTASTVAPRGARVFAFNPNVGQTTAPIDALDLGEANRSFVVDPTTETLLSPDPASGTLWTADPSPFPLTTTPINLGVSIDYIAVVNNGLYGVSSFGGNFLFRHDLNDEEDTVTTVATGQWPATFRVRNNNESSPTLTVLNAWDSTIDHVTTGATPTVMATTNTGFAPGSTERVPDLAIDPTNTVVAVAYPEFGEVRVRNLNTNNTLAVIEVPDVSPGDGNAVAGELQVYFNQGDAELLYVLDRDGLILHRYDTAADYTPLESIDLNASLPMSEEFSSNEWLFHDVAQDRLYVGPLPLDPVTGAVNGDPLVAGHQILAVDALRNFYWVLQQLSTVAVVVRVDRTSNMVLDELPVILEGSFRTAPQLAFDIPMRRFYVANPVTAVIDTYTY